MTDYRADFRAWLQRLPKEYGKPLTTGQVAGGGCRDYQELIDSIAKRTSRSLGAHKVETAITESAMANAWAFRDARPGNVHGIIVTTGLIERMQGICWGARDASLRCLRSTDCPVDFRDLWGALPRDDLYASAFARLLAHAAIVLLMHHELAHIVIGHGIRPAAESVAGTDGKSDSAVDEAASLHLLQSLPATDLGWMMAKASSAYRSQSKEVDADYHALVWTDLYLRSLDKGSVNLDAVSPEDRLMVESLLSKDESIRFVLICASWALFLALGGKLFDDREIAQGTHPQVGVRLAMLSHVEHQVALARDPNAKMLVGAAGFAGLIGSHIFQGDPGPHEVWEIVGFKGALDNWAAVIGHVRLLGDVRRAMQSELAPLRLKTHLPEVDWW